MITQLGFRNFKCFGTDITIPISRVNLLTGINGRGKSTTLQSLLLMRQSPEHNRSTDQIVFNGSCVELGNYDDVRNSDFSRAEPIEISFDFSIDSNITSLKYTLSENLDDDMVAQIEKVDVSSTNNSNTNFIFQVRPKMSERVIIANNKEIPLFWRNLLFERMDQFGDPYTYIERSIDFTRTHYISADRIGPRDYYIKQSFTDFPNVGRRGEYTANILLKKGSDIVDTALHLQSSSTNTVIDQTEAWLNKIFDGGKIKVTPTDASLVLLSLNSENENKTYRPNNVGFGYSYALPIIVSGLIAKSGELVIVENPEAHLHPYAQSQLAQFLARLSKVGVQVYIESHSDHILNGLRIAVLDNLLENKDLNILYYYRSPQTRVTRIPIKQDGSIDYWPEGFFDQTNKDFTKLFGL